MGQAFLDLRMPPLPPLPPPLPLLPPPYNPAAAAAFAHVHPNAALAHPPMPVLAPPALPARLRRRHRHGAAPAPVPVAAPPPPALPVMPPPPPPQLLAHDPRRNPRRNAALAAEDMVRLAAGAGVLDAVVLGEGIHRPHRADKARGRPIRVERHR
ncbi:uncharacterized protein PHACADRAFT_261421 [Phanerochaete carnosa HHB-10118-sp]|uniref:Uncharacterized protein n=1 Tax=Phanerochaete carnosa (strain HHB-10118-sp) TaxID=650164 RepID=K5WR31_PHACS|nr:uncharacterized protein PHACADRAFT_261421 [Phanerochaete carnosa HHB-10118-sp]EKM52792.1 hypothetical protein PHACADRAFT_261421 [Phanerochaete carnosa HHB-10118-sp]